MLFIRDFQVGTSGCKIPLKRKDLNMEKKKKKKKKCSFNLKNRFYQLCASVLIWHCKTFNWYMRLKDYNLNCSLHPFLKNKV